MIKRAYSLSRLSAAYAAGRRAALIKLSGAPESLNPLGWTEHGAAEPEKTPAQELLATGAGILAHMAGDPQELNKAVPPPANRIPEGAVDL